MPDLVVVAFPDAATAFEARAELVMLQREYLIEMEDVVVVTRDEATGAVALHQAVNMTAAGALGGGMWGALVGLLFLNPLLGAATGAAAGAAAGALAGSTSDVGIDDNFLRDVGRTLDKGGAAICVLIRRMTVDKVLDRLGAFRAKGRVVSTSFTHEQEARLKALVEAGVAPMPAGAQQMGLATG